IREAANTNSTSILNNVSSPVNTIISSFTTVDQGRERAQRNEFKSMFRQYKEANGNRIFTLANAVGSTYVYLGGSNPVNAGTLPNVDLPTDPLMIDLEDTADTGIFSDTYNDEVEGAKADFNNLELTIVVSPIPTSRIHKDHPKEQIIGDPLSALQPRRMTKTSQEHAIALYGPHQAPRAWYETLSTYLLENGFGRGIIDKTLFIMKDNGDILINAQEVPDEFYGGAYFFLGLQVMQKDGFFINKDMYVVDILKKIEFSLVKTPSTPIQTNKELIKDEKAVDVDVHLYRSMIRGSLDMEFMMNLEFKVVVEKRLVLNGCLDWIATAANNEIHSKLILSRSKWLGLCFLGFRLTFTVNEDVLIRALIDGKKIIITVALLDVILNYKMLKVFANMKREGKSFSKIITPLFETIRVQAPEEVGEVLEVPIDTHYTPIVTQPSSSQRQKKKKSRRTQRKETEQLEGKKKKRTHGLKRMYKVGLSARIVSSNEEGLGDQEDASKQGRMAEIDCMGDEHLNTILATESDEFIKSCVKNLVPNPSESECDMPAREEFTTFSNILFNADYEFESSDNQSCSDEDVPEKIFSNPLFEEGIIPIRIDQHHDSAESTHDSSLIISSKIDSLLDEFTGELTLLKSIPPGIDKTDCYPEEDIRLIEILFDSRIEEINLSFNLDDPMPPGIEEDDDDSERDILICEELLDNYSLSLPENDSFYFDILLFSRLPAKPPDGIGNAFAPHWIGDNIPNNQNGWIEEDPKEDSEEDPKEDLEGDDDDDMEMDDEAEVIDPYMDDGLNNLPPPNLEDEEIPPTSPVIPDADGQPIPPIASFGQNFHFGESSSTANLLTGNSKIVLIGPMCPNLGTVWKR
nr:hypothetical protein [Tanacetum cinerariifolium]GEW50818.1 hypothetical protein [Tanacetum cinerariifolium]